MFHEIEDLMKKNNSDINVVDNDKNGNTGNNRLSRWHHNSSRIIRVSRASGGKDRHSKVWTSKGPRDRRVRLSVSTALQFYDLQDRLGYDQPSKAIEWLIKAAEDSISELPILNTTFPNDQETPQNQNQNQNQTIAATTNTTNSMSKSGCSSNSDTSKNSSGLSLSRSELRDKARERARERTAKERVHDDDDDDDDHHHQDNHHHTSFTELLTAGRQWIPTSSHHPPMEYLIGQNHFPIQTFMSDDHHDHHHHDHDHQVRFLSKEGVDNLRTGTDDHHDQHQELSFIPDHLISPGGGEGGGGGGFNLDFNMSTSSSSGVAANSSGGFSGYNRGTLQSNSTNHQSFITNLQRYNNTSSENDINGNGNGGGGAQFLFGALPVDNHNQFQIYYENGCRNSDQKGKGKN